MSVQSLVFTLEFELLSYWHIGSGLEGGAYADALALKAANGLPYIPGKSIKGLLREAFHQAQDNNWLTNTSELQLLAILFGSEGQAGQETQGLLQVSSATLSDCEQQFFATNPATKASLFSVVSSTAIDQITGVAKETSLRSMEVAVPMTMQARVSINRQHPHFAKLESLLTSTFDTWLTQVVTLITNLGAKRNRGLGQVIVTSTAITSASAGGV
jgi:CRISPR/Cas system CSM-associated protein Csm3 (group 7 of RAMP superfamily)